MPPRILAIDFGTRRIGVAVSDGLGITAQGLATLERTQLDHDLRHIAALAEEYAVERVIVGNPLSASGRDNAMSLRAAAFAAKVRRHVPCPVELWDERLTSAEANRVLRESGMGIEKRRRAVDRVAVTLLLQQYLDRRAQEREEAASRAEL